MFLLCVVIFATLAVLAGYFVLIVAGKAERGLQKFGKILAIWIFILAALPVLFGGYMAVSGHGPLCMTRGGHMDKSMHSQHGEKWRAHHDEKWRAHHGEGTHPPVEEGHPSE